MENKEEKRKELKHKVLEVLEGGLHGKPAARIFSITLIVLILLSITFMLIWDIERFEPWHEVFEIVETITIGVFTVELILGFWTADVRYPGHPSPRLRYMTDFMTNVQFLAILPFYLGLLLQNTPYDRFSKYFELLKLLHLLKIGQIGMHAYNVRKMKKCTEEEEKNEKEQ